MLFLATVTVQLAPVSLPHSLLRLRAVPQGRTPCSTSGAKRRLEVFQSHFPHWFIPQKFDRYLCKLDDRSRINLFWRLSQEVFGSWIGKPKTNKQKNPLNHKALLNSSALSTKHLREIISSVRVTRQELFHFQTTVLGFLVLIAVSTALSFCIHWHRVPRCLRCVPRSTWYESGWLSRSTVHLFPLY